MLSQCRKIAYRKIGNSETTLTPETVLQDTIDTCLIITKRGSGTNEEKTKFAELQKGIRAFGTGFLIRGNFRIDDAIQASARIAYLSAKLLKSDLAPIGYYSGQDVKDFTIEDPNWNFLNRLKRQPDKSSFYYWHLTVQLLNSKEDE